MILSLRKGLGHPRLALALFLTLLCCYGYFFPRWADWNQNSRFDLVLALVDDRTVAIDSYVDNTGDYAYLGGHYYSDKAPGLAFLAVPVYATLRMALREGLTAELLGAVSHNRALGDTLTREGRGLSLGRVYLSVAQAVIVFFTVALPSALLGVLFFAMALRLCRSVYHALGVTLLYGLATSAFPYSSSFVGHQVGACLLFGAFVLLVAIANRRLGRYWTVGAGFLLGLAVITEYPCALIGALLGGYALWTRRDCWPLAAGCLIGGAIPPLALMALYDLAAFGTPLPTGYSYSALWQDVHQIGFFSLTFPQPEALWGITFGSYRGLFFLSPFLLFALPGYVALWRDREHRPEFWVLLLSPLSFLLFNSSSAMWQGGYAVGPRYLVPALPFLALASAVGLRIVRRHAILWVMLVALASWSFFAVWAETIAGQSFPDYSPNPLFDLSLPRLLAGDVARNFGMLLGLGGWRSLIPLMVAVPLLWLVTARLALPRGRQPALTTAPQPVELAVPGSSQSDWRFLSLMAIVLLVVTSLPTIFGYWICPPDKWYSGIAGNVHDTTQYLSWMREAGSNLFSENKLTSEPNPPVFLNLHWWIPGRIASLVGLDLIQAYHLFRVASVLIYLAGCYWFCGLFFQARWPRRFAFLLCTFTSGAGWVWVVDKYLNGRAETLNPLDVYGTPGNTLQVGTIAPHHIFALSLLLVALGLAWKGLESGRWSLSIAAGLLALFLGLGHIYDLVTLWAVLGTFGLLVTLRDGFSLVTLGRLLLVVLLSAPAPLYFGWLSSGANPVWQRALAQYDNLGVFTPSPEHLAIYLGGTFVVALAFCLTDRRGLAEHSNRDLLLKGWLVANLVIIYLPLRFQIMLLAGIQVVTALLVADGLYRRLLPWVERRLVQFKGSSPKRLIQLAPALFILLVLPTNLYLLLWRMNDLSRTQYPYYLARSDIDAMRWLSGNGEPEEVVLSALTTGHFIPGIAGSKAFLSNAVMTMDFYRKQDLATRFFDPALPESYRLAILEEFRIDYIFHGPAEKALGSYDPAESPRLVRVFSEGGTSIFRASSAWQPRGVESDWTGEGSRTAGGEARRR